MNVTEKDISEQEKAIYEILETVSDPEIPVLSVLDLGIVRKVDVKDNRAGSSGIRIGPCNRERWISFVVLATVEVCDIERFTSAPGKVIALHACLGSPAGTVVDNPITTTTFTVVVEHKRHVVGIPISIDR